MNTASLRITIPGEIVSLPDLTLAERVALSHIHNFPGASNGRLARLLFISKRGVESTLQRLRERQLIEQIGKGRARKQRLKFHVEHHMECVEVESAEFHIKCGENEIVDSHISSVQDAAPKPEVNVAESTKASSPRQLFAIAVDDELERAGDCLGRGDFEGALRHCQLAKDRVDAFPQTMLEARAKALSIVIESETCVLVAKLVFEHAAATKMTAAKLKALFVVLKNLSAERLAQIRPALDEQAMLGTLVDISALLTD